MDDEHDIWATASVLLTAWPEKAVEGVEALIVENLQTGNWARAVMWQGVADATAAIRDRSKAH